MAKKRLDLLLFIFLLFLPTLPNMSQAAESNKIGDKENNQKIGKIMGHKITIKYNIVDEIEPSPSGKYMYIFSKVEEA